MCGEVVFGKVKGGAVLRDCLMVAARLGLPVPLFLHRLESSDEGRWCQTDWGLNPSFTLTSSVSLNKFFRALSLGSIIHKMGIIIPPPRCCHKKSMK